MKNIKLNKLEALINPFKKDIFGLGKPLNKETIKDLINNLDLEESIKDDDIVKISKKIALLVNNKDKDKLVFNMNMISSNIEEFIVEGKLNYVAALIREDNDIEAYVIGDLKDAVKYLGATEENMIDENNIIIQKIRESNEKQIQLVHFVFEKKENTNWDNIEFCLKKIENGIMESMPFISKEILENPDFQVILCNMALKKNELNYLPKDMILSDVIINYAINNSSFFNLIWQKCYSKIYIEETNNIERKENIDYNDLELIEYYEELIEEDENYHEYDEKLIKRKIFNNVMISKLSEKEKNLMSRLNKECFSNLEWVKEICKEHQAHTIYKYLSENLKRDANIIKWLIKMELSSIRQSIINYDDLHISFFNNYENNLYLLNNLNHNNIHLNQSIYKAIKRVTQNKNNVLSLLDSMDSSIEKETILAIWKYSWAKESIKKEKDIIMEFLNKNKEIYPLLSEINKSDLDVVEKYLNKNGSLMKVPTKVLKEIKDLPIIEKAISENPKILLEKSIPLEWKVNKQYISYLGNDIHRLNYNEKQWEKILGKDPQDYIEFLILCPFIHNNISEKIKMNEDVAILLLEQNNYNEYLPIPQSLFSSKNFCLQVLKLDKKNHTQWMKYIPSVFLSDREFLKELLPAIDNNLISSKILEENQKLLDFFNNNNVKENYSNFFMQHLLNIDIQKNNSTINKKMKI